MTACTRDRFFTQNHTNIFVTVPHSSLAYILINMAYQVIRNNAFTPRVISYRLLKKIRGLPHRADFLRQNHIRVHSVNTTTAGFKCNLHS